MARHINRSPSPVRWDVAREYLHGYEKDSPLVNAPQLSVMGFLRMGPNAYKPSEIGTGCARAPTTPRPRSAMTTLQTPSSPTGSTG